MIYHLKFNIGNVYIADMSNSRIRKVTVATGIITTIAGTGTNSFSGDNGAATSATMSSPQGVAVDTSGILYEYHCTVFLYLLYFLIVCNYN